MGYQAGVSWTGTCRSALTPLPTGGHGLAGPGAEPSRASPGSQGRRRRGAAITTTRGAAQGRAEAWPDEQRSRQRMAEPSPVAIHERKHCDEDHDECELRCALMLAAVGLDSASPGKV
mmetsp:Transcript_121990/g.390297  ORF Transcript_121990/g.390297 Transcript_121990/m.390297 type:complete len:118 (-) Transcript_121990:252-605(-)